MARKYRSWDVVAQVWLAAVCPPAVPRGPQPPSPGTHQLRQSCSLTRAADRRARCPWLLLFKSYIVIQRPSCDTPSELLGTWLRQRGRHHSYPEVKSRKARARAPRAHGAEDTRCKASAVTRLIPKLHFVCFLSCRVNILKISFKRKKFFIHQRQKQVSYVHTCFVSWVCSHFGH